MSANTKFFWEKRGAKMKIIFDNKEELILQAKKDGACWDGIRWAECRDLKTILIECPIGFRMWALKRGYVQFAKYFDFSELDGCDIVCILIDQPQFAKKCDFSELNGDNISRLLHYQPEFAQYCDFNKLSGWNIAKLLSHQPQFMNNCDLSKLDKRDINYLLGHQPQLAKYFGIEELTTQT